VSCSSGGRSRRWRTSRDARPSRQTRPCGSSGPARWWSTPIGALRGRVLEPAATTSCATPRRRRRSGSRGASRHPRTPLTRSARRHRGTGQTPLLRLRHRRRSLVIGRQARDRPPRVAKCSQESCNAGAGAVDLIPNGPRQGHSHLRPRSAALDIFAIACGTFQAASARTRSANTLTGGPR
jgi:hypothetical protein